MDKWKNKIKEKEIKGEGKRKGGKEEVKEEKVRRNMR